MDEPFVPLVVVCRRFVNLYIQKIELKYGDPYDWLRDVGTPIGPLFMSDDDLGWLMSLSDEEEEAWDRLNRLNRRATLICRWSGLVDKWLIDDLRHQLVSPQLAAYHVIGIQGAYARL